ncbi:adenosine receptor A2b isoform X2 [Anarrhichthys ocellatus]|uniref:adenosine receptor A2b isoform X2 n=1 Tax=Anarrhichthys ocellatus TaxID=433405 RepID=UPI0012ED06B4|nr:adenosine receptor A2b isoform X2 [Anarrhichthys ocellatus]
MLGMTLFCYAQPAGFSPSTHFAEMNAFYIVIEVVIAVLSISGNVLVCWAVAINTTLKNATNYFLVSLAVADILVGCLAIPFAITISIGIDLDFYGCLFLACFVLVLTQSSIFSLLAIAIDRYLAVKIPLRYKELMTGKTAREIIAILWILSFVIGLIPFFGWNLKYTSCRNGSSGADNTTRVGGDLVQSCNLRKQLRQIELKCVGNGDSHHHGLLQKEIRVAKSLSIIVGLFAVCWLPVHILNCLTLFYEELHKPEIVMYVAIILSHANSAVNPVIYAYRIQDFRNTFRKILTQHVLCRREELYVSSNSSRSNREQITMTIDPLP